MSQSEQKNCQICGTNNALQANFCSNCGATLGQATIETKQQPKTHNANFGETDLMEGDSQWRAGIYMIGSLLTLLLIACGMIIFFISGQFDLQDNESNDSSGALSAETNTPNPIQDIPLNTSTPRPTLQIVTVTPAPPTATLTPTLGPCEMEVQPNDTLISILVRCGHKDLDVMNDVLEINGMSDSGALSLGQIIEVPRPTETPDPNAASVEDNVEGDASNSSSGNRGFLLVEGADGLPTFTPTPSPTLPPGVQWHIVQTDENIITVAFQYGANVEILSQLNPEIAFAQCDFGKDTGGPDCTVMLFQGQQVRVPAPTPTPTLSPTPSGSETPTPSATPTFNAPNLISPGQRVLFLSSQLITLRWSGTGTLGENQAYRVSLQNITTGEEYTANTRDTFFILPTDWQKNDGQRYDYTWWISIIDLNDPETPRFKTETRLFTWEAIKQDPNRE